MTASILLDRLDRVRRAGPGRWRALCPVHGGGNPSAVSIRETDDGCVLACCHVCGATGLAIADAVGVDPAELFPPHDQPAGEHRRRPERRPWTAADALMAIAYEVTIIAVIARDIAHGAPVTPETSSRLLASAGRLSELAEVGRAS